MTLAQRQADDIAAGLTGHWRPYGLTLGQMLIMEGYPLAGDLTQGGYRSEKMRRDEWGQDQIYVVIETALQTRNGQQQSWARDFLTRLPSVINGTTSINGTSIFIGYFFGVNNATLLLVILFFALGALILTIFSGFAYDIQRQIESDSGTLVSATG